MQFDVRGPINAGEDDEVYTWAKDAAREAIKKFAQRGQAKHASDRPKDISQVASLVLMTGLLLSQVETRVMTCSRSTHRCAPLVYDGRPSPGRKCPAFHQYCVEGI